MTQSRSHVDTSATEQLAALADWLKRTPAEIIDDAIETAFSRHSVKKGRRDHYRKVIMEALNEMALNIEENKNLERLI